LPLRRLFVAQCSSAPLRRAHQLTSRPPRAGGAEIVEQEIPAEPGRGQVQVRNEACGICSWDLQTFRIGLSGPGGGAPPGHEGLGTIVKLGEGVRDLKVGDKVTGGGFASVKNLPASQCYLVPEGQAGLANEHWVVEPVACIVTGIDRCEAKPGQRIAIVGCGFMGLMIIQGLKGVGLNQLIALDVDDDRLAMAMEMGATEAHNSAAEGFDEIKRDLATREIDCVVDSSGAQPGLDLATDIVKRAGLINRKSSRSLCVFFRSSKQRLHSLRLDEGRGGHLRPVQMARQGHLCRQLLPRRADPRPLPARHPHDRAGHHRPQAARDAHRHPRRV